ncbi:phenylacetate--CoA ligase family protein [Candidatus Omnitrophota bacterium]
MRAIIQKNLIFPFIELIRGEPISSCLTELEKSQWYSRPQLRELQLGKLKSLISYCYEHIPFYRQAFQKIKLRPADIGTFEDFKRVPFLTKDIIRDNHSELLSRNFKAKIEYCHSGGTQGRPLHLVRDSLSSAYGRAALFRGLGWYGIHKEDKQLRLWGLPLDHKAAARERRKDFFLNRKRISAFQISKEKIAQYSQIIKRFRPKYIYGYVSAVFRLCQVMQENNFNGEELNIKYVVTTAENLSAYQRNFIEKFFNCRVVNEYGCGEMGPVAFECPKGNLHINMENILVEFIESDRLGKENSEIVLTNLNSFSMPLLRYKIFDTGQRLESECPCGRGLETMGFNAGRVVDTLMATDGHFVAGNVFRYIAFDIIEKYAGIKDFRVVQKEKNKLEIALSRDKNFSDTILNLFTARVKEMLGEDMAIEYIFREDIPVEPSGKRLYVYSELKDIFHERG